MYESFTQAIIKSRLYKELPDTYKATKHPKNYSYNHLTQMFVVAMNLIVLQNENHVLFLKCFQKKKRHFLIDL